MNGELTQEMKRIQAKSISMESEKAAHWLKEAMPSLGVGRLEGLGGGKHGSHFGHQILEKRKRKESYIVVSFDNEEWTNTMI